MAQDNYKKTKLEKLIEILRQETDEQHPMSTSRICKRLAELSISCDRRTLGKDMTMLNAQGYEIMYLMRGHEKAYYIEDRSFSVPELKILIDAVQAASFITENELSNPSIFSCNSVQDSSEKNDSAGSNAQETSSMFTTSEIQSNNVSETGTTQSSTSTHTGISKSNTGSIKSPSTKASSTGISLSSKKASCHTPTEPAAEPEKKEYRVLITSDVHHTHLVEWYGMSYTERTRHWVDAILYEHEQQPLDLILIIGDVSLDHWAFSGGGSYLKENISTTKLFINDYVSRLPAGVPVYTIAGNHEQYSNEQWVDLTGNERQTGVTLGNNLFLLLESFGGELDPTYHHDGVYTPMDMEYINAKLEAQDAKNVWLVSHYFDMKTESGAFKKLLADNERIRGLFQGHTHYCSVLELGEKFRNLTIAQTGNFSYSAEADVAGSFWGFRDLIIREDSAVSRYIIAESDATIDEQPVHIERTIVNQVEYTNLSGAKCGGRSER